jgi:hypothetical protein
MSSFALYSITSQEKKFLEYSTNRWDFQSAEIFASENISGFLERASVTEFFFPFTYSISNHRPAVC